jgi:hypothetical protein
MNIVWNRIKTFIEVLRMKQVVPYPGWLGDSDQKII